MNYSRTVYYVVIPVSALHEYMLAKWQTRKMGKINDKIENIISGWFFVHWFQHDVSMVLRNEEISYFIHKPIRV